MPVQSVFSPGTMSSSIFPTFSSIIFRRADLMLRSLIHWRWVLCKVICVVHCSTCSCVVWVAPFVKDAVFSTTYILGFFVNIQVSVYRCVELALAFNPIPLINVSIFMPIPWCSHCCSPAIQFETWDGDSSSNSCLNQNYLNYNVFCLFVSILRLSFKFM